MFMFMILSILSLMIITLLILINYFFSFKSNNDREKPSPFECGFNPITNSNFPFSIQFFLIGLMFLIFDMEILLLIPTVISMNLNNSINWFFSTMIILLLILMTSLYEWNKQSMLWLK